MFGRYSLDTLFNASPELRLILEVVNEGYLPPPDLLGKVPDLFHGHKLATVSTV